MQVTHTPAIQANNNNHVWRSTGRAGYQTTAARTNNACVAEREFVRKWNRAANRKSNTPPHVAKVSGQLNHQELGKIPSPSSMNSSQNHSSMTSLRQSWYFENTPPQYPGDSEWRGNESQLTRPLSVKELHHHQGRQIHEALTLYWPFTVAINCACVLPTITPKNTKSMVLLISRCTSR